MPSSAPTTPFKPRISQLPVRDPRTQPSATHWLLSICILLWFLLSFVDSAFDQAQVALFSGHIVFPRLMIRAALILLIGIMLVRGSWNPVLPKALVFAWVLFAVWLFVDAIFLEARFGGVFKSMVLIYYRFYFFLLMLPLATALSGSLTHRQVEYALLAVALPIGILGFWQYWTDKPILPTESIDETWQVFAWRVDNDGNVRAFSLFESGWCFGHFMIVMMLVSFFMTVQRRWPLLIGLAAIVACFACIYASLTRITYVVGAAALVTALLMGMRTRLMALIPLVWTMVGYMVAFGVKDVLHLMGLIGAGGVFSATSLDMRQEAWMIYGDIWFQDFSSALFGAAVTPGSNGDVAFAESTITIDNAFIEVGSQVGLVGVILWASYMICIWLYLLAEARRRGDVLSYAIASFWATWPLSLMFGSGSMFYALLAILAVIIRPRVAPPPVSVANPAPLFKFPQRRLSQQAVTGNADVGVVRQV